MSLWLVFSPLPPHSLTIVPTMQDNEEDNARYIQRQAVMVSELLGLSGHCSLGGNFRGQGVVSDYVTCRAELGY